MSPTIRVDLPATLEFGKKHRGELLTDVPSDYIRWVLREVDDLDGALRGQLREELDRRRADLRGVEFVRRAGSAVVHLSLDGDPPLCGAFWRNKPSDARYTDWPGGKECSKGCFR